MKSLHTATAVIEIASGILLLVVPSMAATFLFGAALTTSVELALARMTGVALLALGAACWLLRNDAGSQAGRGLVGGMVIYNVGVAGVLAYSSIGLGLSGIGLWPAVPAACGHDSLERALAADSAGAKGVGVCPI